MSDESHDWKLEQFLNRQEVDIDALGDLHRQIEADDPWRVPCPEALRERQYLIQEHVRIMTVKRAYDVCHAGSGHVLIACREPKVSVSDRACRMIGSDSFSGFEFEGRDMLDQLVLRIKHKDRIRVFNHQGNQLGYVRGPLLESNRHLPIASVAGSYEDGRFVRVGQVVAHVAHSWNGLAKELFTQADVYRLEFSNDLDPEDPLRIMILAAVLCADIDRDQKERGRE